MRKEHSEETKEKNLFRDSHRIGVCWSRIEEKYV